jgi:hypothetical protein
MEIIAHLDQGQQYFRSAEIAGSLAGPLEQYYGVLAISRAIILYRDSQATEGTLEKKHGLSARLPNGGQIEDIEVVVDTGTFDQFLDATGNVEQVSIDVPHPGTDTAQHIAIRSLPRPPRKTRFKFLDVITRMPRLRSLFEEAFGTHASCYAGRVWFFMGALNVAIYRDRADLPSADEIVASLRMSPRATSQEMDNGGRQFSIQLVPEESLMALLPIAVDSLDGKEHTIIEPYKDGWSLSELASYIAAANTLSTLVRYHPTRWARMLGHVHGDRLMPVIERLRALIQSDFVRLVLWELERPPPASVP